MAADGKLISKLIETPSARESAAARAHTLSAAHQSPLLGVYCMAEST